MGFMSDINEIDVSTLAMSRASVLSGMKKVRAAYLDIKRIDQEVQTYKIPRDQHSIFGRTQDNTIILAYPNVSRHHSKVYCLNDEYIIEDLDSTNGTYINAVNIAKCVLHPNDIIQIGDTKIIYYEREEVIP